MKVFLQRILQEIMKKNNTWNITRLVNESFVPANQRIILKIDGFLENTPLKDFQIVTNQSVSEVQ